MAPTLRPKKDSVRVETVALCGWPLIGTEFNLEQDTVLLEDGQGINCPTCLRLADRVLEVAANL